jgi:hypothetical protein
MEEHDELGDAALGEAIILPNRRHPQEAHS